MHAGTAWFVLNGKQAMLKHEHVCQLVDSDSRKQAHFQLLCEQPSGEEPCVVGQSDLFAVADLIQMKDIQLRSTGQLVAVLVFSLKPMPEENALASTATSANIAQRSNFN